MTNHSHAPSKTRHSDEIHGNDQSTVHVRNNSTSKLRKPKADGRQDDKTATELCAYAVLWWTGLAVAAAFVKRKGDSGAVSRRLVGELTTPAYFDSYIISTGQFALCSLDSGIQHVLHHLLHSA